MEFIYHHRMKAAHRSIRMLTRTYENVSFEKVQNAIYDIACSLDVLRGGKDHEAYEDTVFYALSMLEPLLEELRVEIAPKAND